MFPAAINCFMLAMALSVCCFAQFTNIKVNSRNNKPNEVSVAINPAMPSNISAGANLSSCYYSTDYGNTWSEISLVSSTYGVWGDPCLAYDASGNLYYGHLSNPSVNGYWIDRIVVQKSTNGGRSFDDGSGIGYNPPDRNQDKEWLTADITNSAFRNNIYMSWTEFDKYGSEQPADSTRIAFSRSTDGGSSWSRPIVISDRSGDCRDGDSTVEGAVPAVGPGGEIYISWAGPDGIMFDKSLDGGVTFGKDIFAAKQPGGWDFSVPGIYRANGLPVTVCDISNSRYKGNIYINWSDQRNGYTDVFIIRSTDGGSTWGPAKKVNDKGGRDRFFTWACTDPATGYLWIIYYDRSLTSGNATDVFVSRSTDGGESFTHFKVSESSFTPNASVFFGDYTNIAALNGRVYPIWTRLDNTLLSIWTAPFINSAMAAGDAANEVMPDYELEQNYPNPFNPTTLIRYTVNKPGLVVLKVYDLMGHLVSQPVNSIQQAGTYSIEFDAGSLPSGIYFYELRSGSFADIKKMAVIR